MHASVKLNARLVTTLALAGLSVGCGYHEAGHATSIPPDVKTIAIPMFVNHTPRYRIEQMLTAAVTRAFVEQTNFQVTHTTAGADAVLQGTVNSVETAAVTFDPSTGRATAFEIQVTAAVRLTDLHTQKVLFANPRYVFREQYQVSESAPALFEEDTPALERLSRDFARTLVTDIVENF
jgi:hypothetical protein